MAVHPLRPATHRRLGGPLPRQLANGPRTHLPALPQELSYNLPVYVVSHSVLSHVSMCYPKLEGRLSTCYSPVRRSGVPKDLTARLACLKRAASVRSEPGSNSPLSETREQVPVLISFLLQFILSYSHEPAYYFISSLIYRSDFELTEASGFRFFLSLSNRLCLSKNLRAFQRAFKTLTLSGVSCQLLSGLFFSSVSRFRRSTKKEFTPFLTFLQGGLTQKYEKFLNKLVIHFK